MEPGTTRVMEPILEEKVQNQKGFVYQVKWDGVRMLAFVDGEKVVLQNRNGRIKTSTFPELQCLKDCGSQPFILDGEVVSIRDGKPDFGGILRRNFASQPGPGAPPVSFVVFDIIKIHGEDLRPHPLRVRQQQLASLAFPPGPVTGIDNFQDGEQLFVSTQERKWEGIVAKDLSSPYIPGKSPYWKKIKHKQIGVFPIIGQVIRQGQLTSLLVGNDFGRGLVMAGAVGSGLSNAGRKMLQELLKGIAVEKPPVPIKKYAENWKWVRPLLQAEVVYMEWTESLTLRAPVFKKLYLEGQKFELP